MRHLSLAQRILLESSQRVFNAERQFPAVTAVAHPTDWNAVVDQACVAGAASMVYAALQPYSELVPEHAWRELRAQATAEEVCRDLVITPALDHTLQIANSAGYRPVVIKGAALASTVYPEPAFRTFSDIDLLLPCNEAKAIWILLRDHGYELDGHDCPADHHLPALLTPTEHMSVEIHRQLLDKPHALSIDMQLLLSRATSFSPGGFEACRLSNEDELLLACLHLSFAHRYRRHVFRNLTDILGITTVYRESLDWAYVVEAAHDFHAAGAIFWPLHAAQTLLGAPVPGSLLEHLRPSQVIRGLVGAFAGPAYMLSADTRRYHSPLQQFAVLASLYHPCSAREFAAAIMSGTRSALRYAR